MELTNRYAATIAAESIYATPSTLPDLSDAALEKRFHRTPADTAQIRHAFVTAYAEELF